MIILNDLDNLLGLEIFSKYTPELKFEISISELNSFESKIPTIGKRFNGKEADIYLNNFNYL